MQLLSIMQCNILHWNATSIIWPWVEEWQPRDAGVVAITLPDAINW